MIQNSLNNNIIDELLPPFGTPSTNENIPIWDECQHMFIADQYTSAAGNTSYSGVRFADKFISILHIGLYHTWTYINDVEVYMFDGKEKKLIGKKALGKTFYNEDLVRSTTEDLLKNYLESQLMIRHCKVNHEEITSHVRALVDSSYCSLINDPRTRERLEAVKPLLLQNLK